MLLCLTANHRNASIDLLERLSVGAPLATKALVSDEIFIAGAVVLATCNRFEAYLDIDEPLTAAAAVAGESVVESMAVASGIDVAELRGSITVHSGHAAAEHLFAVTSGLESVVIGEEEISGQVRRALESARAEGTSSGDLERIFQRALHTSRGVRSRTDLHGAHRSIVRLALDLASSRVADWTAARVVVVGTGRYAATTVNALHARGAHDIRVFSPSGRATAFAAARGLGVATSFADAAADADVVVTCTVDTVVHPEAFTPGHRVLVVDLGLPRNVDPAVVQIAGVELLDLETVRLHASLDEFQAPDHARELVGSAVSEFAADVAAGPAITALRADVQSVLESELERARARGAGTETEAALRHFAGVLMHQPSVRIRELAAQGRLAEVVAAIELLHDVSVPPAVRDAWSATA